MKRTAKYVGLDVHQTTTVASVRERSGRVIARAMLRLKALYRARGIQVAGEQAFSAEHRAWWLSRLPDRGPRMRAELLMAQIDLLRQLRPRAQLAMIREARRDPAYEVLRSIPFFGPVRVSLLMATIKTPWRFRRKRNLWGYAGLAVVTKTSAEYAYAHGRPVRRRRKPLTRGLNRNYNRFLKNVPDAARSRSGITLACAVDAFITRR